MGIIGLPVYSCENYIHHGADYIITPKDFCLPKLAQHISKLSDAVKNDETELKDDKYDYIGIIKDIRFFCQYSYDYRYSAINCAIKGEDVYILLVVKTNEKFDRYIILKSVESISKIGKYYCTFIAGNEYSYSDIISGYSSFYLTKEYIESKFEGWLIDKRSIPIKEGFCFDLVCCIPFKSKKFFNTVNEDLFPKLEKLYENSEKVYRFDLLSEYAKYLNKYSQKASKVFHSYIKEFFDKISKNMEKSKDNCIKFAEFYNPYNTYSTDFYKYMLEKKQFYV